MAENNTILLLGYSDDFFNSLKDDLAQKYYIRAPGILLGLKDDLENGSRPLAIVAYLQSMGTSDFVILNKLLKDSMSDIPMVLIGSQNECGLFCTHVISDRRFRLILPITVTDVRDALEQCKQETELTVSNKKILIVDDDRLVLATLRGYLNRQYTVDVVATGHDALNYLKKNRPDLILLDYFLPDITGAEVVTALRANCILATIPFIFLTASADRSTVIECLKLHPADYLVKPIHKAALLTAIQAVFAPPAEELYSPRSNLN